MFGKIFPAIFDSTLMADGGSDAVYLMMSLVVLKDRDGAVNIDGRILSKRLGLSQERFDDAMRVLMQPDPDSNLSAMDGRRVVLLSEVPFPEDNRGYFVVNHEHYRKRGGQEEKRESDRIRMAEKRNGIKSVANSRKVSQSVADVAHTYTYTDTDKKKERGARTKGARLPSNWEPSKDLVQWVFKERPDLVLENSVESFRDYWGAQPGQKGVKLDWDATFRNWVRRENAPRPGTRPAVARTCSTCKKPILGSYTGTQCDPCWKRDMGMTK